MEQIPDRTSNAGPNSSETPRDWHDYAADAREEITDAMGNFWGTQTPAAKAYELRCISKAIEALQAAKALLEAK